MLGILWRSAIDLLRQGERSVQMANRLRRISIPLRQHCLRAQQGRLVASVIAHDAGDALNLRPRQVASAATQEREVEQLRQALAEA